MFTLLKTLEDNNCHFSFWERESEREREREGERAESKLITAKQVWLESSLGILSSEKSITSSLWDFILVFK